MKNFERITQDENTLANWLSKSFTIECDVCPALKKCSCTDKTCQRLIYEWLKSDAEQEPEQEPEPKQESEDTDMKTDYYLINMSYVKAIRIIKTCGENTDEQSMISAIYKILSMETINAVTKDVLKKAVVYLFNKMYSIED